MQISPMNIFEMVTDQIKITIAIKKPSHVWTFDWHIYLWHCPILKVHIKVMHISTVNILKMMIQIDTTLNCKIYMGFRLAYLHLTFANSKVYSQGHAHFDSK